MYFADAEAVSLFMWGRSLDHYAIFQFQTGLPCDIHSLREELQRRESPAVREGIPLKDLPKWKAGQDSKNR